MSKVLPLSGKSSLVTSFSRSSSSMMRTMPGPEVRRSFMIRQGSGIICVPMEEDRLARLELPQMVASNSESHRTAFTVSVDVRAGTTTGVSSSDRTATIHALADIRSKPHDLRYRTTR